MSKKVKHNLIPPEIDCADVEREGPENFPETSKQSEINIIHLETPANAAARQ